MKASLIHGAVVLCALAIACGGRTVIEGSGEWQGTITTEDGVTTVVNEAGSVWGGRAKLVEEASIGSEAGPDEYIFGFIMSVFGTDEHIYAVDGQAKLVRRYDHHGVYLETIGGIGQGAGEYLDPTSVAVAPDGRILVFDGRAGRAQIYSAQGASIDSWLTADAACCAWPVRFDADGVAWFPTRQRSPDSGEISNGVRAFGPDGWIGENIPVDAVEVPMRTVSAGGHEIPIPFLPQSFAWTPAGPGSVLVGPYDEYRIQLQRDGKVALEIEKYWEPVPIDRAHAEWQRELVVARGRQFEPGWTWNGAEIPEHHVAYHRLIDTSGNGFLVARLEQPRRLPDCTENPAPYGLRTAMSNGCLQYVFVLDAFDKEGRFLGEIDTPLGLIPDPLRTHVVGDRVIGVEVDDLGTIKVKRYRLVPPGDFDD